MASIVSIFFFFMLIIIITIGGYFLNTINSLSSWQHVFDFSGKFINYLLVPLVSLFGVYLGWRLSQKTYNKQLAIDFLDKKFKAFREIKSQIDDIPTNLSRKELKKKLESDADFCRSLTNRLCRLIGIRNEFIPFIDPEFIDLIDRLFKPLYIIENGSCTFRNDKINELVDFAVQAKKLTAIIEKSLTDEYKDQLK